MKYLFRNKRVLKYISAYLLVNFFIELIAPPVALALTAGPSQPEYASFEPVATTNMVNEFSGDFTYNLPVVNVPGPNGGGYALSLSYHSGASPEEESSWVGYGWTLNPGAINRSTKGLPDDFNGNSSADGGNGDQIEQINDVPINWSASVGVKSGMEIYSMDDMFTLFAANASAAIRYNSYKGFSTTYGIGVSAYEGLASLNYSVSGEEGHSFSAAVNPAGLIGERKKRRLAKTKAMHEAYKNSNNHVQGIDGKFTNASTEATKNSDQAFGKVNTKIGKGKLQLINSVFSAGSAYGMYLLADEFRPTTVASYKGYSLNTGFNISGNPTPFHFGFGGGLSGNFTYQEAEKSKILKAYGYMYQGHAAAPDGDKITDYSVEKESMYNKRDKFLSIPFKAPDNFNVTGEGLNGSFKLHSKYAGTNYPRQTQSVTNIFNIQIDCGAGLDMQPLTGFSLGYGFHTLSTKNWYNEGNTNDYHFSNDGDENVFFRFASDLGGNVFHSPDDKPYQVSIKPPANYTNVPGAKRFESNVDKDKIYKTLSNDNKRVGRSGYIGYHTNEQMAKMITNTKTTKSISWNSFTKYNPDDLENAYNLVNRNTETNKDINKKIGEIATFNEDGNRYVYGLPVFSAYETNMSYSVRDNGDPSPKNNYLVYKDVSLGTKIKVGEKRNSRYASTFLLTEITTPDYIDRTLDGPSADDFGGWTKFNYKKAKNSGNELPAQQDTYGWYKWRMPYNGLLYDRGELCDPRDDMGIFSSGEKEIYFLKSIETKTHIAYFVTNLSETKSLKDASGRSLTELAGSGDSRFDGLGAAKDDDADNDATAKSEIHQLQKLEKIVLYAKNENGVVAGKPLKIVNLDYSYELCKNVLNNTKYNSSGPVNPQSGKLTLKKIWFEYEGIYNAKIAPYEFKYEYKKSADFTSADLTTKYAGIINYGGASNLAQNPDYTPYMLNSWGAYAYKGAERHNEMRPWVYQGKYDSDYDPAAWQLKGIKLPSGGEILVQYEQHEYAYVQDKDALAMIGLQDGSGGNGSKTELNGDNKYYLDLSYIDLDFDESGTVTENEYADFLNKCKSYLEENKVYFKFLYKLIDQGDPDIQKCGSEYIDGYADVTINRDGNKFYLSFNEPDKYTTPRKVCLSYVTRNKAGLNLADECDTARDAVTGVFTDGEMIQLIQGLMNRLTTDFAGSSNNCLHMSMKYSYFRLPLLKAKKGGGVRVKRLLMYDQGIETGDETLLGTEFYYKNTDGTSSGVAANEPSSSREENALVSHIEKRHHQPGIIRIISGRDKEQAEGPIGEMLLPAPSVGYSRVISKNIHSGKTGNGYKVTEYHTYKESEFAFSNSYTRTEIDDHAKDFLPLPAVWVNILIDNRWLSQGYSFILNNMHGQIKRMAVYGGDYTGAGENDNNKSFEQIFEYYKPGEAVPVMLENGEIKNSVIGKEMEVAMEMNSVEDLQNDANIQIDFSLGIALAIPIANFSLFPYLSYTEKNLRTHVTSKVIRYAPIQKSVTTFSNNIIQKTENKAFSVLNGEPVVSIVTDSYDGVSINNVTQKGTYTNYILPAAYIYKNLGQKGQNQGYVSTNVTGTLCTGNCSINISDTEVLSMLTYGDLIRLSNGDIGNMYYIKAVNTGSIDIQQVSYTTGSGSFNKMEIVNSGYTNQLNLSAGEISTYGADYTVTAEKPDPINPAQPFSIEAGTYQLKPLTNVISGKTTTYSDLWDGSAEVLADYQSTTAINANDFETGRRGKWRVKSEYICRADVKDATGTNRVYAQTGTMDWSKDVKFIFKYPTSSNSYTVGNDDKIWLRTNNVTAYSPNGNALEEENILGIKTTAKFGYRESVPVLIAKNAPYSSVLFKSFEDITGAQAGIAHSGNNSWKISSGDSYAAGSVKADLQVKGKGLIAKVWLKGMDATDNLEANLKYGTSTPIKGRVGKVARVGEWILAEITFTEGLSGIPDNTDLSFSVKNNGTADCYIDDLRIQPYESEMACYVYDKNNLRLLASFDDQHFGLYYQYNAEGQLVRKLIETERGLKTISETQYNTPLKIK